ncbi:hypothetical protein B0H13DRAFT_2580483 [Mycena leptocephala]|nr:hypothetical protein B0H13DRAFT_2580483 [Mycena leptocephala]
MNPLFEATVQHPQNHQLFCEIVKQVESQVIKNSDSLPSSLKYETITSINRLIDGANDKTKQLEKAVVPYAAKRRIPAQVVKDVFVHEQYMSDEASGPEDNGETNKAIWETQMALKRGYEHANDKNFLKVLAWEWRSDEMSDAVHEMQNIAFDLLTPTQKKGIHYEHLGTTSYDPGES